MPQGVKQHIKEVVSDYVMLYPDEFKSFKEGMKLVRDSLKDEEYGSVQGKEKFSEFRALYEMPETLSTMLIKRLSEEEMIWFKSGGANHKEGARWFATEFPAFRIPSRI